MVSNLIKEKKFYITLFLIAVITFIRMYAYAGNNSLGLDDMATINYSWNNGIIETIKEAFFKDPTVAPGFYVLSSIWMRIVPYGTQYLRILPIIFVVMGVFALGILGKKVLNKRVGIIASIIAAGSVYLIINGGYAYRPYSGMFFLSVMTLIFYSDNMNKGIETNIKSLILYTLSMIGLCYMHYFGILLCFSLGVYDLYLIIKKRASIKRIFPYVIMLLCVFPYVIGAYSNAMEIWEEFWPIVPRYNDIIVIVNSLLSDNIFIQILFWFSFCFACSKVAKNLNNKENKEEAIQLFLWNIVCVILVVFIVSKYIMPTHSVWVHRYLICILPSMYLLVAYGIDKLLEILVDSQDKTFSEILVITLGLTLLFSSNTSISVVDYGYVYEDVANYLIGTDDMQNEDTAVIIDVPKMAVGGWKYYQTMDNQVVGAKMFLHNKVSDNYKDYNVIYIVKTDYTTDNSELLSQLASANYQEEAIVSAYDIKKYVKY